MFSTPCLIPCVFLFARISKDIDWVNEWVSEWSIYWLTDWCWHCFSVSYTSTPETRDTEVTESADISEMWVKEGSLVNRFIWIFPRNSQDAGHQGNQARRRGLGALATVQTTKSVHALAIFAHPASFSISWPAVTLLIKKGLLQDKDTTRDNLINPLRKLRGLP